MNSLLFIDDDQFAIALYKNKLRNEGFAVDFAQSGAEALEKLERSRPDLVVLDLNMPEVNGIIVLKTIRSSPRLKDIPVIIFSSGYVKALVEEAKQLGIHKLLAKAQCPPKLLIAEIRELLRKTAPPVISSLAADAQALPDAYTGDDLPALLYMFIATEEPAVQHTVLLKIYKASRNCVGNALKADETTAQGKLGRILEKLLEELYARPEHITAFTKHTLAAGLQKLNDIEAENAKPALEAELMLKKMLGSLES
jgi:CheY-like chemotaxis protein